MEYHNLVAGDPWENDEIFDVLVSCSSLHMFLHSRNGVKYISNKVTRK